MTEATLSPQHPASGAASRAVLVLTSARSGSSVATHALQLLGVDLGERLRKAADKNPKGFFEDAEIVALSRRLKKRLVGGRRLALVPEERWRHPALRKLEEEAATLLEQRFGASKLWGFKTGRTLRFLPFWEGVLARLGVEPSYLVALRNPMAAAASRSAARRGRFLDRDPGMALNVFQWLVEIVPYFERLRGRRFLVVEFDHLAAEPRTQLGRIAAGLELRGGQDAETAHRRFADGFLSERLQHHRHELAELEHNPLIHPLARDTYGWLRALARDAVDADDSELWTDWARIRAELQALGPLLDAAERGHGAPWRNRLATPTLLDALGNRISGRGRRR